MKYYKKIIAIVMSIFMTVNLIPINLYESEANAQQTLTIQEESNRANVLLIKNKNPWDSNANETVLNSLRINFDTVTIEDAVNINFLKYKLIIVANDQIDNFYRTLSEIRTELELFVMNGGTLLYGICDAGWGSGYSDLLIPGDVKLGPVSYQSYNYIIDDAHPIVTGVLTNEDSLTNNHLHNNYASHRYFETDSLPADTNIILNAGSMKPTLIEYAIGNGIVIASALTWEHSYDRSNTSGFGQKAFDDLLLYSYMVSNIVSEINKNPELGYDAYVKGLTCTAGDPVNVANGNFITGDVDISYKGSVSLSFSRYYNSLDSYQGGIGRNWRTNYNIYLQKLSERRLRLWHEDGHSEDFIYGDDGVWYATPGTNSSIKNTGDKIVIMLEDKTVLSFDDSYKLTSLQKPYDIEINFEYDDLGKLVLAKQGEFWLNYSYENDLLTKVSDKSGRTIKFQYADGDLISAESYDGKITTYEYDSAGRMTKMDINGEYNVINTYDEYGRVVRQEMTQEGSCQFIYDDKNYTTTYVDKNGASTIYYKDEYGRIYKKEYSNGSEKLEFDNNNNLIKEIDKLGNSTSYEYDERGNCISVTDALGNTITYEYDERNNKTAMIDAENNRFEYTYDAENFLTSQSDAYGNFTYFKYNEKSKLLKLFCRITRN